MDCVINGLSLRVDLAPADSFYERRRTDKKANNYTWANSQEIKRFRLQGKKVITYKLTWSVVRGKPSSSQPLSLFETNLL